MPYILKRKRNYYYNRRIPDIFASLDPRKYIRIALNTDSKAIAQRKALMYNDQIEAYWQELASKDVAHTHDKFHRMIGVAKRLGFSYLPATAVAALPLDELVERILTLKNASEQQIEAVLGYEEPDLMLSQMLDVYWDLAKDKTVNKSPNQLRKWRNPRIKSVNSFIAVIGDKPLLRVTRDDVVSFRDRWLKRIRHENKNADSANKDLIHLKCVMQTVVEHRKLQVDVAHLFRKMLLETRFKQTRLPLTDDEIRAILTSEKLLNLNTEARWFLFAAAETGARPSEIVGLMPEDIVLDAPVPHIAITDRKDRPLKTKHSERKIPLVGYALDAFKAMPDGFPRYRDKPDSLTNTVNKFLRTNDLLPSKQHSVYSLRHGFQDRLLKIAAPERIQAELMGHKFSRPKYGDGGSLEQKMNYMELVRLGYQNLT